MISRWSIPRKPHRKPNPNFDAAVVDFTAFGNNDISPTVIDDLGGDLAHAVVTPLNEGLRTSEDLFGDSLISDAAGEPSIRMPDLGGVVAAASGAGEALMEGDLAAARAGVRAAIGESVAAVDEAVAVPFEPQIEEFIDTAQETVSDFVEDPAEAVNDMADQASDSVAGMADDLGL